jgi:hypothetical protein
MGNTHNICGKYNTHRILIEKYEGKTPLARPRHGWKDNTKLDLKRVGYEDA